jgi:hypothetical protein
MRDTRQPRFPFVRHERAPARFVATSAGLSRIADASGGAVLGVAHHGKDISKGVAGSFAQKANVDFILSALMTTGDDGLSGDVKATDVSSEKARPSRPAFLLALPVGMRRHLAKTKISEYIRPV